MFRLNFKNNFKGFSLIELMVVVAIIGILSAVAVPNFKKYQGKTRTAEAKLQLAAVYTSEQAFKVDYDNFGTCLNVMGFNPKDDKANRFYAVGFKDKTNYNGSAIAAGASSTCTTGTTAGADDWDFFSAGKSGGTAAAISTLTETTAADQTSFKAAAEGVISTSGTTDKWTITHLKQISSTAIGY